MKQIINSDYTSFVTNIKKYFIESHSSIHKARNEIKIVEYNSKKYVVKSFKVPNLANKIIYSFVKKSKAQKSYINSLKIIKFVPEPIAFVEFRKNGLIHDSYFISEYFDYNFTIRDALTKDNVADKDLLFKEFAKFTFNLHENQILHNDYSPGNILIKKITNTFLFKIVDINRMSFYSLSIDMRMKNFSKLWAKDKDLKIIVEEYAKIAKIDKVEAIRKAIYYSQKHKDKINMKKRLRGVPVVD
ncbi:MAG: hypothetical protein HRT41_15120 [Campylobacteraceae bacterium]|nr:hypothetical protein [Campylobacteraceae bacterium]